MKIIKSILHDLNNPSYNSYNAAKLYDNIPQGGNRECFCVSERTFLFAMPDEYMIVSNDSWTDSIPSEKETKLYYKLKKLNQI